MKSEANNHLEPGADTGEQQQIENRLINGSRCLGAVAIVLALVPLVGWLSGHPVLYQLNPNWPEMVPQTVLFVVLSGCILALPPTRSSDGWLQHCHRTSYWVLCLSVLAISLATLVFYSLFWDRGDSFPLWLQPKPASPRSSMAFFLLSCVFVMVCIGPRRLHNFALWLLLLPFTVAMLAFIGYVSTFSTFYSSNVGLRLGMSVPSALAVIVLCVGTFLGPLRHCYNGILFATGGGGAVVRTLVPIVLLMPPLLCLLILSFALSQSFSQPITVAMLTLLPSLLLCIVIYHIALRLEKFQTRNRLMHTEEKQVSLSLEEYRHAAHSQPLLSALDVARNQADQDTFVQEVSHHLRTPLSALRHWLAVLQKDNISASEKVQAQREIEMSIAALDRIISELLGEARGQALNTDTAGEETALSLDKLRVLLVDDETSIREALTLILESYGAQVAAAKDAQDARSQLLDFAPDVIISDIGLPEEDGISFIRNLRNSESEHATVPAIAVTGYTADKYREAAKHAGFNAFFNKPVASSDLIQCAQKLVADPA